MQRLLVEHELAEAHGAARDDGFRARVPGDLVLRHELGGEVLEQVAARERRRELDLRFALAVVELDGDDELFARDGLGCRERRAAAVRELVAAFAAGPALADAIGIREREQPARRRACSARASSRAPSSRRYARSARRTRSSTPRSPPPRCIVSKRVRMSLSRCAPPRSRSRSDKQRRELRGRGRCAVLARL